MIERELASAVTISLQDVTLEGFLEIPAAATGLVVFAHGSGSSRLSPRNNAVARVLRQSGLGTLLVDLLTEAEDQYYGRRFEIELLSRRLMAITRWLSGDELTASLGIGYFGASTGAAAALEAAAELGEPVQAVVSRGGRVDMAPHIGRVQSPTLFIVGAQDYDVLELNEAAFEQLDTRKQLAVIPRATHLFEEPGALERVAELSAGWFNQYLHQS